MQAGCEMKVLKRRIYPFGHGKDLARRGLGNAQSLQLSGENEMRIQEWKGGALGGGGCRYPYISGTKTFFTKGVFGIPNFPSEQKGV